MSVILTDTGPLVALLDHKDPNHAVCLEAARRLPAGPLLTTWPCLTEAMYLLHRAGGYSGQSAVWKLLHDRRLILHDLTPEEKDRMALLMEKYRDKPMDFADASLMAAADHLGLRQLFSLDADFRVYRLLDDSVLDLIP